MSKEITQADIQSYLATHPIVKECLEGTSKKTEHDYTRAIIRFEQLTSSNVEELLKKVDTNIIKPRDVRTLITTSTSNLSIPNRRMIDSAVRCVFSHYTTKLPRSTIKYEENDHLRGYTKGELQQLIGYLDKPLEKLYVIIGAESGLRAATILKLKWKHIQEDFNNRAEEIALRLEQSFHKGRKKSGYTFIGTRARELIKFCTEKGLIKTEPETNLFPYGNHKYGDNSIRKIIQRAKSKANVSDKEVETIHGLRKYFIAQIGNPVPPIDGARQNMLKGRFSDIDAKTYDPPETSTHYDQNTNMHTLILIT